MSEEQGKFAWILPLNNATAFPVVDVETDLQRVGGKGANLARMVQAGFPVPEGFLLTTQAYCDFIAINRLEQAILDALPEVGVTDPGVLEHASERIRVLFRAGLVPQELSDAICAAYDALGEPPVAVRSSATAEDLPEMSFAGQQDTFLNILGKDNLIRAVVECWASLWTARAIGYRQRNRISQEGLALGVVVQCMVESQVSGVLFTANPLTGLRKEVVIDATFGLGEALVSGKVEPDHYVVDSERNQIVSKSLGAKRVSIHSQTGGGTNEVIQTRKDQQALEDSQILALAKMGSAVEGYYGFPQDIEWAWAENKFYLLQSRAITSIFPIPENVSPEPLKVFFSFAAIQGMLDPLTPFGIDTLRMFSAMVAGFFGIKATVDTQNVLYPAGERLWINVTTLLRNTTGRKGVNYALNLVEPTVKQAMDALWNEPRLLPEKNGTSFHAKMQLAMFALPLAGNVIFNLIAPQSRRAKIVGNGERIIAIIRQQAAAIQGDPYQRLSQQIHLLSDVLDHYFRPAMLLFVSGIAAGMTPLNMLRALAKSIPEGSENTLAGNEHWPDLVLELTRGLPHNPTTEMDLALWDLSRRIRSNPESAAEFENFAPAELSARYLSEEMPVSVRQIAEPFITVYGGRGLGEIDLGRKRWIEDPTHVFEVLQSYLKITNVDQAPDVVFARGVDAANMALERLLAALSKTRMGWIKVRLAHFMAGRMRALLGARESPKFFAVRLFNLIRQEMLKTGEELVRDGILVQPDDVFFLNYQDLDALISHDQQDWKAVIARRRVTFQREMLRRQVPRVLLSDGRAFYEGLRSDNSEGSLKGSPVSPGSVEGLVRVVLDPTKAHLQPGEILVCPGTDPSWTPLFLSSGGLVMEVGGMMTHGAVVAREYGIPAVVGVDQATTRLVTGQRIRLNGSTGQIDLL